MSGSVLMVYVVPMLLGQSYDVGRNVPGVQIFNSSTVEHAEMFEKYFTDSQYRMVETSDDIKNFLDVGGHLSLKVKSGLVDASGEGSYLKHRASRSNAIEILIKVNFETITRTIRSDWAPNIDWSLQDKEFLGTHYCRSITYGGELIASIRFLATNRFDKEKIKGAIQAEVNAKSLEAGIKGKLEMLKYQLHDTSSMEIRYYATVPINGVPHDIKGLMKLVEDFPKHVKEVNGGHGNPLRMELYPLDALKSTLPAYFETGVLKDQLEDMEDQFDDLLTTRKDLSLWMSDLPPITPPEVDSKIADFMEKIEDLIAVYSKAIAELNLADGGVVKSFQEVFEAYKDGGNMVPFKYSKKFGELQKSIYKEAPDLEPLNGGATYVRWGSSSCSENEETIVGGIAVSSSAQDSVGSSTIQCSPINPTALKPETVFKNFNPKTNSEDLPKLTIIPVKYQGSLPQFSKVKGNGMPCAICRARKDTSVFTFHATTQCPKGWTLAYDGFTVAPGVDGQKGNYICTDKSMKASNVAALGSAGDKSVELHEVGIDCGILPCGSYKENKPLRCVVCER